MCKAPRLSPLTINPHSSHTSGLLQPAVGRQPAVWTFRAPQTLPGHVSRASIEYYRTKPLAQPSCEWHAPHPLETTIQHLELFQATAHQASQQQSFPNLGDAGMKNYQRSDYALDYPSSFANPPSILPQQKWQQPLNRTQVNVSDFHTAGSFERVDNTDLLHDDYLFQGPASSECPQYFYEVPASSTRTSYHPPEESKFHIFEQLVRRENLSQQHALFQQDAARYHRDHSNSSNQLQTALQMDDSLRDPSSPSAAALGPSAAYMRQADAATESHLPNSGGGPYYWSGGALALGYFMKPLSCSPCRKPNEGEPGSDIFFSADEVNFFESLMNDDNDDWHTQ